jgi:5-formyltetrahydrofolate cyclo-ligase
MAWGPEPLEPGLFGLMEPVIAQHFTPPVQILLVPGLAFDDAGYRIGYGGGFYDALLERLNEEIPTLGVAFSAQRVRELPLEPLDQSLHGVVTELGVEWMAEFDL